MRQPSSGSAETGHARLGPQRSLIGRFDAHVIQVDGHAVLLVRGEIDLATVRRFEAGIDAAFTQAPRVVIDLGEVEFMGAIGLTVLIRASRRFGDGENGLTLRSPSPAVQRLLDVTGVDRIITVEEPGQVAERGAHSRRPVPRNGSGATARRSPPPAPTERRTEREGHP